MLKNFNKSFAKFTDTYKTEQQNEAQDVFDNLKAQGITDPTEIKKLIDKNDPRVANLKGYYTQAIVNSNFGLSHAIEDFNNINMKVANITGGDEKGDAMANLNIDSLFIYNGVHRNEIKNDKGLPALLKRYNVKTKYFQKELKW